MENYTCKAKPYGGPFNSYDEAKEFCNKDENCLYIYDEGCDGTFQLCNDTIQDISGNFSCIYKSLYKYNTGKKLEIVLEVY